MKLRNFYAASVILISLAALAISCTNEMDYENRGISEITATLGDGTSKAVLADGFNVEFIKRTDESERGTRTVTSSVEVKRSVFGSVENLDDDVVFDVGIGSLSISPAEVYVAPMSAVQLSLTVLPSDAKYEWIKWSSTDKTVASVDEDGMVVGKKEGICTITATSDNGKSASCTVYVFTNTNPVDLGLSVKWASFNLGASKPEEYGRYFAWGDVIGQVWGGSGWSGSGFSTYPSYELDSNGNLKPEYDAAHVILGDKWRLPTKEEQQELIDYCTSTWTNFNGVNGRLFTSKKTGYTDKSIFLPAVGYGYVDDLFSAGSNGYYWSSTFYSGGAWSLDFDSGGVDTCNYGFSVRPVFGEPIPAPQIQIDGVFDDWDKVDCTSTYVPSNAIYPDMKVMSIFADKRYVYLYLVFNDVEDFSIGRPFDLWIDPDASATTGGVLSYFDNYTEGNPYKNYGLRWFLETNLHDGDHYQDFFSWGGLYRYDGEAGANVFTALNNIGGTYDGSNIYAQGAYDASTHIGRIEVQLERKFFEMTGSKAAFGVKIMDGTNNWACLGILPQSTDTVVDPYSGKTIPAPVTMLTVDLP